MSERCDEDCEYFRAELRRSGELGCLLQEAKDALFEENKRLRRLVETLRMGINPERRPMASYVKTEYIFKCEAQGCDLEQTEEQIVTLHAFEDLTFIPTIPFPDGWIEIAGRYFCAQHADGTAPVKEFEPGTINWAERTDDPGGRGGI